MWFYVFSVVHLFVHRTSYIAIRCTIFSFSHQHIITHRLSRIMYYLKGSYSSNQLIVLFLVVV